MQIHFISTNLPLDTTECAELAQIVEDKLAQHGRAQDKVIILAQLTYNGSIECQEEI